MEGQHMLMQVLMDTLNPDQKKREEAEGYLKAWEKNVGFGWNLLTIMAMEHGSLEMTQAASIYFKNYVKRYWKHYNYEEEEEEEEEEGGEGRMMRMEVKGNERAVTDGMSQDKDYFLKDEEKKMIKSKLIDMIIYINPRVRVQLLNALGCIVRYDYPHDWVDLVPLCLHYIRKEEQQGSTLYPALLCLYEVSKCFEFRRQETRKPMQDIIQHVFPLLLHLMQQLCKDSIVQEISLKGLIIKIILKIYFTSVRMELPQALQHPESFSGWAQVFLHIVVMPVPQETDLEDVSMRHKNPWWQAKKRAMRIFSRIARCYCNPSVAEKEYTPFRKYFMNQISTPVLQACFQQLDLHRQGQYISPRVFHSILMFIYEMVAHADAWKVLKPYMHSVVQEIIFPLLCFSKEDDELWKEDPYEYIHRRYDFVEDYRRPVSAACDLLACVIRQRNKFMMIPTLQFCNTILNEYLHSSCKLESARRKDGALAMIGYLANVFGRHEGLRNQLESLLATHVIPEFHSPYGFLRARACWMVQKFSFIECRDQSIFRQILENVLTCIHDPELPIKTYAAMAIDGLVIQDERGKELIKPHLLTLVQDLLALTNETDFDEIAAVIRDLISEFAEDLRPFAVQICTQLRNNLIRLYEEGGEKFREDPTDHKTFAAFGIMHAIQTLVHALEESPKILQEVDAVLYPLIINILDKELTDLYQEVFQILTASTFFAKSISPLMWSLLPYIHRVSKPSGIDFFEEIFPLLDNYVSYGKEVFLSNEEFQAMYFDLIKTVLESDTIDLETQSCACQLIEVVLFNCIGHVDKFVHPFIDFAINLLQKTQAKKLRLGCMEVVITALYYNADLTIAYLESRGWTAFIFSTWFEEIRLFQRVHDIKLCTITLLTLLQRPLSSYPEIVRRILFDSFPIILKLFKNLPAAYETRAELEAEFDSDDSDDSDDSEDDSDEITELSDDDNVFPDVSEKEDMAHSDDLHSDLDGDSKEGNDENDDSLYDSGDEIYEDFDFEVPIDRIDEYIYFQDSFASITKNNPDLSYFLHNLNATTQSFVNDLFNKANEHRSKLVS